MGPVTDTHRITYYENVVLAIQEKRAQFDNAFSYTSAVKGKQVQVIDIIGTTEARVDEPEGGDSPDIDNQHEPVWMRPHRLDWGKLLKVEDEIKALTDFKSPYVQSGAAGMVRAKNNILAGAIFGPRLIGNEVPVSTAWAGQTVAEDYGTTGTPNKMSVKKILHAIRLAEEDDVVFEEEDWYLGLDPEESEALWNDVTFTSKDYREQAQLDNQNKRTMAIFGIPIIHTKRIANADSDTSTAGLWAKRGMWWGPALPLTTKVAENPNKQFRQQVYIEEWLAATRSEDKLAIKILNHIG